MATGFLGFIKKFGQVAAKAIGVSTGLAPLAEIGAIAAGHPEIAAAINKVENLAVGVEAAAAQVGGLPGPQKLAMLAPAVDALIQSSGYLSNRAVADLSKWNVAVLALSSAIVDMSNATVPNEPATK